MEQPAGAALQRWRLLIAYDGAAFRGFAVQPQVPTVAGALRQAIERTARLNEAPAITCAGRTDAGVHARGQVVHVDLPAIPYDGVRLARALNRQLAPEVVVRHAEVGRPRVRRPPLGHRADVPLSRLERTRARSPPGLVVVARARPARPALHADGFGRVARHARLPLLLPPAGGIRRRPAARAPGHHGAAGRSTRAPRPSTPTAASGEARLLRFEISAVSFCHQMVRSLVGSLVEVGRGRENAAGLMERLRAASRHQMPDPAPAPRALPGSVAYGRRRPRARPPEPGPAMPPRRLAPSCLGPYPGTSALGTPGSIEPARGPRSGGWLAHHAEAKDRSCAHIFTEGHRDPAELVRRRRRRPRPRAPGLVGGGHPARQAPPLLRPPRRHRRPRDRGQRRQGDPHVEQGGRQAGLPPQRVPGRPALHLATPNCSRRSRPSSSAARSAACSRRTRWAGRC